MILQALVDYYGRRSANPDRAQRLAPYGWIRRPVDYAIELDQEGEVCAIDVLGTVENGRRRGQGRLVPAIGKQALKHDNSGTDANLLWDGARFVIGEGDDTKRQSAFLAAIEEWLPECDDTGVNAVRRFVERLKARSIDAKALFTRFSLAEEFAAREPILVFRLRGDSRLVHEREAVAHAYELAIGTHDDQAPRGRCLVSGETGVPVATNETVVKGVRNAQTAGANVVSFNAAAFCSYAGRRVQHLSAPIGRRSSFAYTTALGHLLDSTGNRIQIGDATTVIWSDRDEQAPAELVAIFGDDPDAGVASVRRRLDAIRTGALGADASGLRYFVLGLSPNAARLSVRFFLRERFETLAPRLLQHFDDLRIVRSHPSDPAHPPMYRLLKAISVREDSDNIPPRTAGEWMRAILEGTAYPASILNGAVNRCRAEQATRDRGGNVTYLRAAILKASLNRAHRVRHGLPQSFQLIHEELDMSQEHPAYRLGRLFAVLERIQEQSAGSGRLNATIRDRYYGAASSTPGAVFPTLLRLKNAHLNKLESGRSIYFERLVGEVCGTVDRPQLAEFPRQLDLYAQGLFALGYYHQRQSFFSGKTDTDEPQPAKED